MKKFLIVVLLLLGLTHCIVCDTFPSVQGGAATESISASAGTADTGEKENDAAEEIEWFRSGIDRLKRWLQEIFVPGPCFPVPPLAGLERSNDGNLIKLKEYQDVCGSYVTDTLMIFTTMPENKAAAESLAMEMSYKLKEFSGYGVRPIVIVEPAQDFTSITIRKFELGRYDEFLETYFKALKSAGVTDAQMGVWVPFPEANLTCWNDENVRPEDFGTLVNRYLRKMQKYFPSAKGSILLDVSEYEHDSIDSAQGRNRSLVPYIRGVDPQLLESIGVQGFPWVPEKGSNVMPLYDPDIFLGISTADEAASFLGIRKIWFNTGTFGRKYRNPEQSVVIAPSLRRKILTGILEEVVKLKKMGYQVSVNLFAENKLSSGEATDWSYWHDPRENSPGMDVFRDFMRTASDSRVHVSLFDLKPDRAVRKKKRRA